MVEMRLPPGQVGNFIKENPSGYWRDYLMFLLNTFPQVQDGKIQYLIEGGAAVFLYHPNSVRSPFIVPHDIDVVCKSRQLRDQFYPPITFDFKTLQEWLELRGMQYSEGGGELLLNCFDEVIFEARKILVLSPVALALSKSLPFLGYQQRFKDVSDLKILGVPSTEINDLKKRIEMTK